MSKYLRYHAFTFCFMMIPGIIMSQKETKPTSSFTISGDIKNPSTIAAADLQKLTVHMIGDVAITNHLGEKKSDAKGLKGVLLRDVLQKIELNAESPKVFSEFYFVCKANDGYTIVYSWNELFNTATGDSACIVTEKEGKTLTAMSDAILMITSSDLHTGRRYLKSLSAIEVKRVSK